MKKLLSKRFGKYIVIEGIEGAGKSTICNNLKNMLTNDGVDNLIITREPGGTILAEKIRNWILNESLYHEFIHDKAELLMFYAARVQLVENYIKPALRKGYLVIGDRHDLSTQAYQGGGRGINKELIMKLRKIILGNFFPDLTLYLDIEPTIGLERVKKRVGVRNRIERESLDFFNRVRNRYIELAEKDSRVVIINANASKDKVVQKVYRTVKKWIKKRT